jgi:hypothetical protein
VLPLGKHTVTCRPLFRERIGKYVSAEVRFLGKTFISLSPVASTLEDRASVKSFVSLQFINPKTIGRIPWIGDQPIAVSLLIQTE